MSYEPADRHHLQVWRWNRSKVGRDSNDADIERLSDTWDTQENLKEAPSFILQQTLH